MMKSPIFQKIPLAIALPFVLLFSGTCFATNGDLGGEGYDGSSSKPFQISDAADLRAFAVHVNSSYSNGSAWAVLTENIDLNNDKWAPIGNNDYNYSGTFNGQNHTISGLYINSQSNYAGLFGYTKGATIKNVGIINSSVTGASYVGAIVGYADYSVTTTIDSCFNEGSVTSTGSYVGGIAGSGSLSISNSHNTGSITSSENYAGGIVANTYAPDHSENGSKRAYITNCYNTGSVTAEGSTVGGIAGCTFTYVTVTNCYNTGNITGVSQVGGVIGYPRFSDIDKCYNTGNVKGIYTDYGTGSEEIGGVVGFSYESIVSNCYNTGDVHGRTQVGGVAGETYLSSTEQHHNGSLNNCYSTGAVSGERDVGGVTGYNFGNGTIENSYYNTDAMCSGCNGAVGRTDNDKVITNVEGLSADEIAAKDIDGEGPTWASGSSCDESSCTFPYLPDFGDDSKPIIPITKFGPIVFADDFSSASIDGYSKKPVSITRNITVSGDIIFYRKFPTFKYKDESFFFTIMLPFSTTDKPTDVTFLEFNGLTIVNEKWAVMVSEVTGNIEANKPYLIRKINEGGGPSIVFKGGTFVPTAGNHEEVIGEWSFKGTYEYKTWSTAADGLGKDYGFAGTDGNDKDIVGQFRKIGSGAYIYPMRAYLEYAPQANRPGANGAKPAMAALPDEIDVIMVDPNAKDGEQTTKVLGKLNTRTGEFRSAPDHYYDMNGRSLGNKKPSTKGTYYNNGQKIIIK